MSVRLASRTARVSGWPQFHTLVLLLAMALLLAGCVVPVTTTVEGTATAESAAAAEDAPQESDAETDALPPFVSTSAEAHSDGSFEITHALGVTTLPAVAQRVAALDHSYIEMLLALGIQPVAVADSEYYRKNVNIPVALDDAVVDVGARGDENLETLIATQPDLILAPLWSASLNYDLLSAVAPTVPFDPYSTDPAISNLDEMLREFRLIAEVTGTSERAEEVIAQMGQTFADDAARIAAAGRAGEEFVLSQAYSWDNAQYIDLFTPTALASQVVERLGLVAGWDDGFQYYGFSEISPERLPELGLVNYFYAFASDDNIYESTTLRPLWESLPLVQAGRAYPLGAEAWFFGGPLSMQRLADIVTDAMLGEGQ